MHLLPRSLFGRLVLVLLVGLLFAQALSAALLMRDRGSVLREASGWHVAQRVASAIRLLEAVEPAQHPQVLEALRTPLLRAELLDGPSLPATTNGLHAVHLQALVQRIMGERLPLRVAVLTREQEARAPGPTRGPLPPHRERLPRWRGEVLSFHVEAQLSDGSWVALAQRVPEAQFGLPGKLLLALLVLLISVVVVSLLAVRGVTRPLRLLAEAAETLGRDIDRPPLAEEGPLEVRRAARAFNTMQARLRRYLQDRERLLAAVSHDLRTPITRLRLRTEMLDDPKLQARMLEDLAEMQAITEATLEWMRDGGRNEPVMRLDVLALLEAIQADRQAMGQQVSVSGTARPYPGRPVALRRAVENLIDNAIKYAGAAEVHLADTPTRLTIRVLDRGPGIPPHEQEQVLTPFYRVEGSRSRDTGGVGLGLSIAHEVARGHGGELTLRNRPGGGLAATLMLPR